MPKIVDLHCHSIYSDGYFSLKNLFKMATNQAVELFSITDHDTLKSQKKAQKLAKKYNIKYLTGVEISCQFLSQCIHIVGLNFDCHNDALNIQLEQAQQLRTKRAQNISQLIEKHTQLKNPLKKLNRQKYYNYGRLHFSEMLVQFGLAKDSHHAFQKYLTNGANCYVATEWMQLQKAIQIIKQAGGKAILAHPLKYKMSNHKLKSLIQNFKDCGGDAIEVINGRDNDIKKINHINNLAKIFKLEISCGSDFHHRFSRPLGINIDLLPKQTDKVWNSLIA